MIQILLSILVFFIAAEGLAESTSNDFGVSDTKEKHLTSDELRNRFELLGEIFVSDSSGRLLYQGQEIRRWRFGTKGNLTSNWSFTAPGIKNVALKHIWSISKTGELSVRIQQFEWLKHKGQSQDVEVGPEIRKENIEIKNFAPVTWLAQSDKEVNVVVRFTPTLTENPSYIEVKELPMSLYNPVVFDNKGRLWAQGQSLEGRFLSMKTHLGQLAISYTPFKGSKEIGVVRGNELTLSASKDLKITLKSEKPILATSKPAKIYGFVDISKKSSRVNSVYSTSSNQEGQFLESL